MLFLMKVIQIKNNPVKIPVDNSKHSLNKSSSHKRKKKNKAVNKTTMIMIEMKTEINHISQVVVTMKFLIIKDN
jgi:hypothetical protein